MLPLLRQISRLFDRRERRQLVLLGIALVVRACVELVGVGAIAPFMSVVADPGMIQQNAWLARAYAEFGFTSPTAFLTALGVAVIVVLALSNTFSALALWWMLRFSWNAHHRISQRLFRGYLAQPYGYFVSHNTAQFSKNILTEVQAVIQGVVTPVLNVGARGLVVVALTLLLVLLDPFLALLINVVLGGAYGSLYLLVKKTQRRMGRERADANELRFKTTNEAFGGIKDVKVLQREASFVSRFRRPSYIYSRNSAVHLTIAQVPRYLFETIAFGGVVMIVLYYLQAGAELSQILPTISLYAFAGYRLMPELQQLFSSVSLIRYNRAALDDLTADLDWFVPPPPAERARPLPFGQDIRLDGVTFSYANADAPALDGISLRIEKDTTVGLVGPSGSGKTTLVDLLLGLYTPDAGRILVDGEPLDEDSLMAWRRQVGYVPQQIFLCDDSIALNIAIGVPAEELDRERMLRAARIAHLDEFVSSLPDGYDTVVGERGVRLSGGQRQRIGIARALYHDPAVLIMDEATSALDGSTEGAVMEAIHALAGQKTIVLIAHRFSTVQECDQIFLVDAGRLAAQGTYEELLGENEAFRAMARVN